MLLAARSVPFAADAIETCLAVRRVHAAGLRAGCNIFVTTTNTGQAGRLLEPWSGWRSTG
jgi:hypothetical protein